MAGFTASPDDSKITIYTFKHGLLSKIAHDLVIDAPDFDATLQRVGDELELSLTISGAALTVTSRNVSADQKREIQGNIRKKVLDTARHPQICVSGQGPAVGGPHKINAQVELHGRSRSIPIEVAVDGTEGNTVLKTRFEIKQSDFGIKPYSAMMGTLKTMTSLSFRTPSAKRSRHCRFEKTRSVGTPECPMAFASPDAPINRSTNGSGANPLWP